MNARRVRARLEQLERLVCPAEGRDRNGLRDRREELRQKRSCELTKWEEAERAELNALFAQEDEELNRREELQEKKFNFDRLDGDGLTEEEHCELGELNRRYRRFETRVWPILMARPRWPTPEEEADITSFEEEKYGGPPPEVEEVEPPKRTQVEPPKRTLSEAEPIDWGIFDPDLNPRCGEYELDIYDPASQ